MSFAAPSKDTENTFSAPASDIQPSEPWYQKATDKINSAKQILMNAAQPIAKAVAPVVNKIQQNPLVQIANKANLASPTGLAMKMAPAVMGGVQNAANVMGEKTATGIASTFPGLNPQIPAAVGTAVQMAPDVALSMINPEARAAETVLPAAKVAENATAPLSDLRSAIQLRGKTYVGNPGDIHADVINKIAQETGQDPNVVIDSIQKIGDQGFSSNGKFLSRDQVRQMTNARPEAASLIAQGKMGPNATIPTEPIAPTTPTITPTPVIKDTYAVDKALSAIGTPRKMIKSPEMLAKAQDHAQTLLDAGLIKPLQSPQGMADKLGELETQSGEKIGSILDTLGEKGKVFDPQSAITDINQLRPISKSTGQILRGGAYDKINGKIDDAVATIQAHLPKTANGVMNQPISFQEANDLKGVLQGLANYASNKDATVLDKVIAAKFRENLDNSLNQAATQIQNPQMAQEFQQAKKLYSATQFAKDPIYNKLSGELMNKKLSLTDWILGSHSLATGNPLTGVLEVALKKGFEKYGSGTQAYLANKLSKTPSLLGSSNQAKAYGSALLLRKKQ